MAHLCWQGGVVVGLLLMGILFTPLIKKYPRDLIFTTSALLTPLFGIVPSGELYTAGVNQVTLTILGLWAMGTAMRQQGLFHSVAIHSVKWKKHVILLVFLGTIFGILAGAAIGSAFFFAGLLLLLIRPFPLKKSFREEFPLPLLLEIFGAYVFFFAMQNSGLSAWAASFVDGMSPLVILPLFFFCALLASHVMPCPLAFAVLFSVALTLFPGQPDALFLAGANIALAAAVPLFSTPLVEEFAISHPLSGKTSFKVRAVLILILFGSFAIPSCLFWPN
jgi:hypothetical protein